MVSTPVLLAVLVLAVGLTRQQEVTEGVAEEAIPTTTPTTTPAAAAATTPSADDAQETGGTTEGPQQTDGSTSETPETVHQSAAPQETSLDPSPEDTEQISAREAPLSSGSSATEAVSPGVDPGLVDVLDVGETDTVQGRTADSELDRIEAEDGQQSDCDFSESTCWWQVDGAPFRHFSWRRGSPESAFYLGGPVTDAGGGEEGAAQGYVFVDASVFRDVLLPDFYMSAWLTSPTRPPPGPAGRCLRFKYNAIGASVGGLRVLRVDHVPTIHLNHTAWPRESDPGSTEMPAQARNVTETVEDVVNATGREYVLRHQNMTEVLWEARDAKDGVWKDGKISFNTGFDHRIVFEVVPNLPVPGGRGYVAIDDVSLVEGACDNDCGFEQNLCSWINVSDDDDFDWQLGRGSRKRITGPIRDQSSVNSVSRIGGYAFIDSSHPRRPGDIARLESAVFESPEPLCLSFYTNMFGSGVGRLSVREVAGGDNPTTRVLWSVSGGSGSSLSWELGRVTIASPNRFLVQLEAEVGEPGSGDIAVDSIRVETGACPTVPASAGRADDSCDFRDDTCGWQLSGAVRGLWSRVPGGHVPIGSPPLQPADHFLSFDLDGYEHQAGARDRVLAPVIHGGPQACLTFWVYLASHIPSMPRIGGLQVLLFNTTTNDTTVIWRADNHLRHGWVHAQAPFAVSTPVRLALEATRGSGVSGLLGVDDVVVHEGDCAVLPPAAAVSPLDCWFDEGECRWTAAAAAAGTEGWQSASTGAGIPQLLDHTHRVETGYEYFDPFNQRSTARLVSAEIPASTQLCVSLWYTCLGGVQQDASLSLRRQLGSDNSTSELLWQVTQGQSGHTGRRYTWRYGQVQAPPAEDASRIVVEAIGMQAGFAIDDIRVVGGEMPCPVRPEWARPVPPP